VNTTQYINNTSNRAHGFIYVYRIMSLKVTIKQSNYTALKYEGWNFNSGNYLFTTDTK